MSNSDKAIYVSSMIGGEKAKQQKGGSGRTYSAAPEHYVTQIDAAYAQGDRRDPAAIFSELADRK